MSTHKALVITAREGPIKVLDIPIPTLTSGSALVNVLVSPIISYMPAVYTGRRPYPYPTPLVPGMSAIARINAVGPDAARLKPGQLVYVDCFIRGRDKPDERILAGLYEGFSEGGIKMMKDEWRFAGTFAQIARVPLENCYPLDEERLLGKAGLGLRVEDLAFLQAIAVPFGGFRDIGLQPGETVVIAPATGGYGGAGIYAAFALGAGKVIAMGRSEDGLKRIGDIVRKMGADFASRTETVRIVGDVEEEAKAIEKAAGGKPVDVYLDLSPPTATTATHMESAILSLRPGGRISLMGGFGDRIPDPQGRFVSYGLTLKGKLMYEREDMLALIRLAEIGSVRLGEGNGVDLIGKFGLEEWEKAFEEAERNDRIAQLTLFAP